MEIVGFMAGMISHLSDLNVKQQG